MKEYGGEAAEPFSTMLSLPISNDLKEENHDGQFLIVPVDRRVAIPRVCGLAISHSPGWDTNIQEKGHSK